ncbi:MAG: hypothetical protein MUO50_12140 [Longimicrobiales bacterium]|nr:hypothetical protein [Longimicrobiales bacterium]
MAEVSCSSLPHLSRPTLGLRLGALVLLGYGVVVGTAGCRPPQHSESWAPAAGLKTRWAADVDPTNPLPEYPRPQMVRPDWMNLNGLWDFALLPESASMPEQYPDRILVPFPVESALSGVTKTVEPKDRIWYRRAFSLPQAWEDSRWLLHFGAVDWEAEVFLNGGSLGTHRGGYDPFSFDITDRIVAGQDQELVVAVRDPTNEGNQPRGKQVLDPHGIWYTAVSGIWQTVWLEPVPESHIGSIRITPGLDLQSVEVMVEMEGSPDPAPVLVTILDGDRLAAEAEGVTGEALSIPVPEPRAWSPDDPFLYGLRVRLMNGFSTGGDSAEGRGDEVESYFGMRSIAVGPDENGHQRLLLNGEPLFQYGLLDQGWWPDGLYSAPTDEALRFDVEKTKELGFNLIRKHVKVEPARWYYHCDRVGLLVWQDMPSANNEGAEAEKEFVSELGAVVSALRNHPSIVMWVPFNEGWGQHKTEEYVEWLRTSDPSRLVNNASGWTDTGVGEVLDIHRYPGPGAPSPDALSGSGPSASGPRAAVLGEFGGLGLPLAGHTWVEEDNWGYRFYESLDELNQAYEELLTQLRPLIGEGLAAAVYTQTTDVEVEVNGIMTYDREVVKLGGAALGLHRNLFGPPPILRPLVATSITRGQPWRFTTSDPGEGWAEPGLDDSGWPEGRGGFGTERTPGSKVRTVWDTPEIWIRRTFSLPQEDLGALADARLFLRIHHDEDAEVYLNGVEIATLDGYSTGYRLISLTPEALAFLASGENTLAVHVRQTDGGQYIDVGIVEWIEAGEG